MYAAAGIARDQAIEHVADHGLRLAIAMVRRVQRVRCAGHGDHEGAAARRRYRCNLHHLGLDDLDLFFDDDSLFDDDGFLDHLRRWRLRRARGQDHDGQ